MSVLQESLEREQFLVESARTYQEALRKIIAFDYDCILLDIMLPGGSGLDLLKELKAMQKSDHVIIISAKDSLDDKLAGLHLGADDYLTKPFHIAELHARILSVLRRKSFGGKHTVEAGNLQLDLTSRTAHIAGSPLALNRKEFDVLLYLLSNKNRVVNKSSLAEHVWGDYVDAGDDYEFVYSQIKNLRKKLRLQGATVEITAVYGFGYKLVET